jgi:hypothetical protein
LQTLKQIYGAGSPAGFPAGFSAFRPISAALPAIALLAGPVIAFRCAPGRLPGKLSIDPNSSVFQI